MGPKCPAARAFVSRVHLEALSLQLRKRNSLIKTVAAHLVTSVLHCHKDKKKKKKKKLTTMSSDTAHHFSFIF